MQERERTQVRREVREWLSLTCCVTCSEVTFKFNLSLLAVKYLLQPRLLVFHYFLQRLSFREGNVFFRSIFPNFFQFFNPSFHPKKSDRKVEKVSPLHHLQIMARIQYSRMTFLHSSSFSPSPFSVCSPSRKTFFFLLILINIQASSFYTLEEGGESEKSFNSLDFYSSSLGGRELDQDPLMPGMRKGHCDTLTSKVHVTKEEKDENGLVYRTCEGDLTVSKCEGTCNSQLHPSVASPTGFKKVR